MDVIVGFTLVVWLLGDEFDTWLVTLLAVAFPLMLLDKLDIENSDSRGELEPEDGIH